MHSLRFVRPWVAGAALCAVVATARAQNFNLDVGTNTLYPLPSATFGAGANRSGVWCALPVIVATPQPLTDIGGTATAVTSTMSGGTSYHSTAALPGATVDDIAFMADIMDPLAVPETWTFTGLAAGVYDIYTYAMAPDTPGLLMDISVAGSVDPLQRVGGAWLNYYPLGITHAKHHITVATGVPVVVTVMAAPGQLDYGSVNGFQIVSIDLDGYGYCSGDIFWLLDHTTPCPCANYGALGHGCANSANPAGAHLVASGSILSDTVVLSGSGMPAVVACIYLQGDGADDVTFGDGVLCTGGTLIRLRMKTNVGGASSFPDSADTITLSARGGVVPGSGALRSYQTYYRNSAAAFCPPATFNVTNGWSITW